MKSDDDRVLVETRAWIDEIVVGLGLCPFAEASIARGGLAMVHSTATDADALALALREQIETLQSDRGRDLDGCLLIHPRVLNDFEAFNDFLDRADQELDRCGAIGVLQIASFHPAYRFAGTRPEDVGNYTNRSPYPMLHLLREVSVERALATFADPDRIPARNVERLERLGIEAIQMLLASCRERAGR